MSQINQTGKYISYRIAGLSGLFSQGPYTDEEVLNHYNDVRSFEGVCDCKIEDKDPLEKIKSPRVEV